MNVSDFAGAVSRSPLEAALVAWLGGLLVSLTPCVYPMVAITVSVFGAKQAQNRWHGIGLSSAFVLGIVTMFTPLGVLAGMSGSLFGSVLQSPWVLTFVAFLFLAMAASLFGAFEVALPSALTNRLARVGGLGGRGAFGLGLVCGLIAAPCTGPVLTGILTWIAQEQSPVTGGLAMLAFSLGLGVPFFLVGALSVHLPKSGRWMVHVKSLLAIVMAVVGFYYLSTAFPFLTSWVERAPLTFIGSGVVFVVGLALGAVHRDFASPLIEDKLLKSIGAASTTLAALTLLTAWTLPERELDWLRVPLQTAKTQAQREGRPLLVDFTASWCGACKELDAVTFAHPDVQREAGRFVAVKIDATDDEDPAVQKVMSELGVVGLPTVLLISSAGEELRRFTDFVPPQPFLVELSQVD